MGISSTMSGDEGDGDGFIRNSSAKLLWTDGAGDTARDMSFSSFVWVCGLCCWAVSERFFLASRNFLCLGFLRVSLGGLGSAWGSKDLQKERVAVFTRRERVALLIGISFRCEAATTTRRVPKTTTITSLAQPFFA